MLAFWVIGTSLTAQKLDIVLKGNKHLFLRNFVDGDLITNEYLGGDSDGTGTGLGLNVNYQIKGPLRVGVEGGLNHSTNDVFLTEKFNGTCATRMIHGSYTIDQYYFSVIPEWRFFKQQWLFVNAGVGYYKDRKSGFTDGTSSFFDCVNTKSEDITSLNRDLARTNNTGFLFGAGVCPTIRQRLILLGEVRYSIMSTSNISSSKTTYGYNYLSFNVGVGVRL